MSESNNKKILDDFNQNNEKSNEYNQMPTYYLSRTIYCQEDVQQISGYDERDKEYLRCIPNSIKSIKFLQVLYSIIPILDWLPKYSIKKSIIGDLTAGITVAVMHIPQGMAYAILAGVEPSVGMYMAFFPTLVYFLFGTSRHISMGTFAVISLMTAKVVQNYATITSDKPPIFPHENNTFSTLSVTEETVNNLSGDMGLSLNDVYSPIQVVTAVSMMTGIYQIIMCIFRLGTLSSLLSEPLVNGFTTAAAVHVAVSQIKDLLGITIPRHKGAFKIIFTLVDIIKSIDESNITTVFNSIIIIIFMVVMNEVLKPLMAKKCRLPIPSELLAVVGGTVISYYLKLDVNYGVNLVGHIPVGLPHPVMPPVNLLRLVAVDSIAIAIVSYSIVMSMALIFAKKHSYEIGANQELLAMGMSNITGAMFSCIPIACSLSRSLIQEQTGGNTQIASVISALLILIVLLWVGPYFEALPRCVLAGVIIVALKGMFMQVKDLKKFYREGYLNALVWITTFLSVVLIDIDIGLLIGIIISLFVLYLKGWKSYSCLLGNIDNTDLYVNIETHKLAKEINQIKIYRHYGAINFASRNTFKKDLYNIIGLNDKTIVHSININNDNDNEIIILNGINTLIIDLSCVSHMDASGCQTLTEIKREILKYGIKLILVITSDRVYDTLNKGQKLGEGPFSIFPTIHDAVLYTQGKIEP